MKCFNQSTDCSNLGKFSEFSGFLEHERQILVNKNIKLVCKQRFSHNKFKKFNYFNNIALRLRILYILNNPEQVLQKRNFIFKLQINSFKTLCLIYFILTISHFIVLEYIPLIKLNIKIHIFTDPINENVYYSRVVLKCYLSFLIVCSIFAQKRHEIGQ